MAGDVGRPAGFQSLRAIFYGWWLVAIAGFIIAVAEWDSGSGAFLPAIYRPPVLFSAVAGLLLPVVGMLVDRWGSKKPMLIGLPLVGIGLLVAGLSPRFVVVSVVSLLVVLGSTLGVYLPAVTVVNHWFRRRRAMAMAVMMFGVAVAGALAKQIPGPVGQPAVLVTAALILAIGVPLAFVVRNRPEQYGEHPDGMETSDDATAPDYTLREAIRTREFWMLILATNCLNIASPILTITARNIYPLQLDAIGNIHTVVHVLFILVGGYVGNRLSLRRALFWFASLHLAAAVALLVANGIWFFFIAAALLGMGTGGVLPLSIAALGAYFGRYRFATILGIYLILSVVGVPFLVILPSHAVKAAVFAAIGMAAYLWTRDPRPAPSQAPVTPVDQGWKHVP